MTSCRKLGFFTWISPCKKLDQRLAKLYDLTKSEGKSPFFFLEHVETFQHGKSLVICKKKPSIPYGLTHWRIQRTANPRLNWSQYGSGNGGYPGLP
jgi:hypothetical protein